MKESFWLNPNFADVMLKAGVYMHIPFCKSICNYCDYFTSEREGNNISRFVEMLKREIELAAKKIDRDWRFDTLYVGGGSPGILKIEDLKMIMEHLQNKFYLSELKEITLEINPGENGAEELKAYRGLGINRLSLGFQSLQPQLLNLLTRSHDQDDCITLFHHARSAEIENINVDMMFNIPDQSLEMWLHDLKNVLELEPEHITLYELTSENETLLKEQVMSCEIQMPDSNTSHEMYVKGSMLLKDAGYIQYEVSHFAKPGMESRHNLHYWKREPNVAFGPSAHGFDGKKRYWNVSSLDEYCTQLNENTLPIKGSEEISETMRKNEFILNGLRTNIGVPEKFLNIESGKKSHKWDKVLTIKKGRVFLNPAHFHLADEIATDFISVK
ncbi:MAG: radical SAM family heme chaperone HemW [Candidatus Marinimicrobia bacterium]|nr:radical SAM family heme chaperone HemW [Candidatus Neomarinimicrobiota bacterium]